MTTAFELARDQLGLVGGKDDPMSREIAIKVVELVEDGERDPWRLCALVVEALRSTRATTSCGPEQGEKKVVMVVGEPTKQSGGTHKAGRVGNRVDGGLSKIGLPGQ